MYLPIFRGRQNELIALQNLVNDNLLGDKIIPIIEPVKTETTQLSSTFEAFANQRHRIGVICNPIVGELINNSFNIISTITAISDFQEYVIPVLYMNHGCEDIYQQLSTHYSKSEIIGICTQVEQIPTCVDFVNGESLQYILIGNDREFTTQISSDLGERILCVDRFLKRQRNVDYTEVEDEFFSSDHINFENYGFKGFSDYSMVGHEFTDNGFAPRAVAIHIIYENNNQVFRIRHFVSYSNDDAKDPARKFGEAVGQLTAWARGLSQRTRALNDFINLYRTENYRGLGFVKRLSIQHHLELVNRYFETNN